mmetsp:Transcript_26556/g.58789  ORF Transcript_26556/g.58789 Transcript_26556/m.58789 type:complete len:226 (+) Transcript_26556:566-1243(+)
MSTTGTMAGCGACRGVLLPGSMVGQTPTQVAVSLPALVDKPTKLPTAGLVGPFNVTCTDLESTHTQAAAPTPANVNSLEHRKVSDSCALLVGVEKVTVNPPPALYTALLKAGTIITTGNTLYTSNVRPSGYCTSKSTKGALTTAISVYTPGATPAPHSADTLPTVTTFFFRLRGLKVHLAEGRRDRLLLGVLGISWKIDTLISFVGTSNVTEMASRADMLALKRV